MFHSGPAAPPNSRGEGSSATVGGMHLACPADAVGCVDVAPGLIGAELVLGTAVLISTALIALVLLRAWRQRIRPRAVGALIAAGALLGIAALYLVLSRPYVCAGWTSEAAACSPEPPSAGATWLLVASLVLVVVAVAWSFRGNPGDREQSPGHEAGTAAQ